MDDFVVEISQSIIFGVSMGENLMRNTGLELDRSKCKAHNLENKVIM